MSFLAAPLIGSAISFGASKLFGGGDDEKATKPIQQFKPTGINAGGLSSSLQGDNLAITPSAERLGLVRNLAGQFGNEANALAGLRGRVTPGFSDLRASRLKEIDDARTAAIGNLRENMARRRVQGSSFGQDALARAELEFGQAREKTQAETMLQELEATNQLIQQEFTARRGQFETGLNDLNLQADVATKLAAGATQQLGANARLESELNAKEQTGKGKFFGDLVKPVADAAGKGFSSFFSGGGGGGSSGGSGFSLFGTGGLY